MFASFALATRGVRAVSSRRGDWRRGVRRAGKVDVRFAWQAWDFGCIDALGKALERGSAWQVWGNVHLDVAARAFHVAGVGQGGHRRCRERGFAWPAWGSVHAACVSRGRRGECCDRWIRWASFRVAGAGNRVRQLKPLDFVALCEKSAVRARVRVLGVAKSWQAQGIRGFVDVSFERTFLGTQRQAASGVSRVRRCAVERSGRLWGWASGVSRVWRVWRCAMGIAGGRVAWVALCLGDC